MLFWFYRSSFSRQSFSHVSSRSSLTPFLCDIPPFSPLPKKNKRKKEKENRLKQGYQIRKKKHNFVDYWLWRGYCSSAGNLCFMYVFFLVMENVTSDLIGCSLSSVFLYISFLSPLNLRFSLSFWISASWLWLIFLEIEGYSRRMYGFIVSWVLILFNLIWFFTRVFIWFSLKD